MARPPQTCQQRISQDPRIMVGKPVVRGTRIPVERVIAHLAQTLDVADLLAAYPELTPEDVKACLEYAHAAIKRRRVRSAGGTVAPIARA
ncbi:MAG TPA: DUF433 domain-containing protein [Chloroflexota bacterium]|nr:DUF433 domain-containing protein [Chloroflexota bacterium]